MTNGVDINALMSELRNREFNSNFLEYIISSMFAASVYDSQSIAQVVQKIIDEQDELRSST